MAQSQWYVCDDCMSGLDLGGALYQWNTPWVGDWAPEECPQCGSGAGIILFESAGSLVRQLATTRAQEGGFDEATT